MNERIRATFEHLRSSGRKALIPYATAGFPQPSITVPLMHRMVQAGADLIELGVPFSDPMADGPVIQRANDRALLEGVGLVRVLNMVREFRRDDGRTPIILMGYANPIERMGEAAFVESARSAGVDGVIVVDLPPEEAAGFAARLKAAGIAPIFLVAPTSTEERIRAVAEVASGYVYYVSLKGVTGAATLDVDDVRHHVERLRAHVALPVGVGFGIRDADTALAVGRVADAVVIGTRIVQLMGEGEAESAPDRVAGFLADVRRALDTLEQK